jgi:GT2 family glycosyltransferase
LTSQRHVPSSAAEGPPVSVIVVHYGTRDHLWRCLNSIITHTPNVEIIVVDNNQLPADFANIFSGVKLLRSGCNLGFGAACNTGAKIARGSVFVFMNNDVQVCEGWLSPLMQRISESSVGCVCPLVLLRGKPEIVNAAGGNADFIALAWNRSMGNLGRADADSFFYAPGCCVAIRREVFDKVGGFDESLFLFLEDVDLSWRIRMAGWNIVYVSDSRVLHDWMGSTSQLAPSDIQYLFNRNRLRVILKNYGGVKLIHILPIYLALQLGLILWILRRQQALELRAVLAAWLWNLRNLPSTIRTHQHTQSLRRKSDGDIMQSMYRGIAGIHLALGTMKHPVFDAYFSRPPKKALQKNPALSTSQIT